MRSIALFLVAACAGCLQTDFTTCGALTCPRGFSCLSPDQADADKGARDVCVSPEQLGVCESMPDGTACSFNNDLDRGYCYNGACKPPVCGDFVLDPTEACDDGNGIPFDGCNADCSSRFAKMAAPTGEALCEIWAGDGRAYAVGVGGTVLELDGARWSAVDTMGVIPSDASLFAVWATSRSVFVGGSSGLYVLDRNSGRWTADSQITWTVNAIWADPAGSNVFVGGSDQTVTWKLARVVGKPLPALPASCVPSTQNTWVDGIWGRDGTGTFVAVHGTDRICSFSEASQLWTPVITSSSENSRFAGDDSTLFALQRSVGPVSCGTNVNSGHQMFQRTGSTDSTVLIPGTVSDIAVTAPTELVAVGPDGLALALDWSNDTWVRLSTPTEVRLVSLFATPQDGVFVVGESGTVLH